MASGTDSLLSEIVLDEKFIELWQEYPCLYDVCCKEYKNRDCRSSAQKEIAAKLGSPGVDCMYFGF